MIIQSPIRFAFLLTANAVAWCIAPAGDHESTQGRVVHTIQSLYCDRQEKPGVIDHTWINGPQQPRRVLLPGFAGELGWPGCHSLSDCRNLFWYADQKKQHGLALLTHDCRIRFVRGLRDLLESPLDLRSLSDQELLHVAYMSFAASNLHSVLRYGPYVPYAIETGSHQPPPTAPFYGCYVFSSDDASRSVFMRSEELTGYTPTVQRHGDTVRTTFFCVFPDDAKHLWRTTVRLLPGDASIDIEDSGLSAPDGFIKADRQIKPSRD